MLKRKLTAILALDAVGYSRRMETDEAVTLEALSDLKAERLDPAFLKFRGRVFKEMGDGMLVEFPSVVDAVQCAYEIQLAAHDQSPSPRAQPHELIVNGETNLDGNLPMQHGVPIYVTTRFKNLEPFHSVNAFAGAGNRRSDSIIG